jgi:hypothetical protein
MVSRAAVRWVFPVLVVGCRLADDTWDFPTTGFARVNGTVTRTDGTPYGNVQLGLSCGGQQPDGFFNGPVLADAAGAYRFEAGAPDVYGPPPGVAEVVLVCRLHAGTALGGEADSVVAVRFGGNRALAPAMTVDLRATRTGQ